MGARVYEVQGLSRRAAHRFAELEAQLGDLRVAPESPEIAELIRDMLMLPFVASLRFVLAPGRARIEHAASAGGLVPQSYFRELRAGVEAGTMSFLFSLRVPEREQRNKPLVIPGVVGLRRLRPSELRRYGKARLDPGTVHLIEHLERYGIAQHFQLRTVHCDGPLALGYFNAFSERPFGSRQRRLFGAAMKLWHSRLVLDRRLADARLAADALEAVMELLGRPAYVVDRSGVVRHANRLGVAALDHDPEVHGQIREAVSSDSSSSPRIRSYAIDRDHRLLVAPEAPLSDIARAVASDLRLGPRATQVLMLLADGLTTKTIAARLGIATNTVEYHLTNIFSKLDVNTRSELMLALHERTERRP